MIYFIYDNNTINWIANSRKELDDKLSLAINKEFKEYEFFEIDDDISLYKIQDNKIIKKTDDDLLQENILQLKQKKLQQLVAYDSSEAVNSFSFFGDHIWLPKELRISLSNTAWSKDRMKIQRMPVNLQNNALILGVEEVLDILSEVEDYANLCFINTDKHRIAIEELTTIQEIENYDFKIGYPAKLSFLPVIYDSLIDNE